MTLEPSFVGTNFSESEFVNDADCASQALWGSKLTPEKGCCLLTRIAHHRAGVPLVSPEGVWQDAQRRVLRLCHCR